MNLPPPPPAPPPPPGYDYGSAGPPRTAGKATASLICGLVGLLLCGVVLGPVAIVLGRQAKREIRDSEGRLTGDGMATAGIVIGIIALVLFVVGVIIISARS